MADELFKRGAEWNYGTMDDLLQGAREDNEWNTKAIDIALAHGWNIDDHYEHVGSALVYTVSESEIGSDYLGGGTVCRKLAAYLLSKGADVDTGGQTGRNSL
jgi:hypothetical protein